MSSPDTTTGLTLIMIEVMNQDYGPWQVWELAACDQPIPAIIIPPTPTPVTWGTLGKGSVHVKGGISFAISFAPKAVVHVSGQDVTPRPSLMNGSVFISGGAKWSHEWNAVADGSVQLIGGAIVSNVGPVDAAGFVTIRGAASFCVTHAFVGAGSVRIVGGADVFRASDVLAAGIVHVSGLAGVAITHCFVGSGSVTVQGGAVVMSPFGTGQFAGAGVVHVAGNASVAFVHAFSVNATVHIAGGAVLGSGGSVSPAGVVHVAGSASWSFDAGAPPTPGAICSAALVMSFATDYTYSIASGVDHWFSVAVGGNTNNKVTLAVNSGTIGVVDVLLGTSCGSATLIGNLSNITTCCNISTMLMGDRTCYVHVRGAGLGGPGNYTLRVANGTC